MSNNPSIVNRFKTIERHQGMSCKSYCIKIDSSKLSKISKTHLNKLFIEAKWLYNYLLSIEDLNSINTKIKEIPVLNKDKEFENRKLETVSSQMKQSIKTQLFDNLVSLKRKKEKGMKVGRLKFKSKLRSIPLKQPNNTFSINFENNYIKIQGLKQKLKVNGLEQIPKCSELASSKLVKFQNNYYLQLTTFQKKIVKNIPNKVVSIDFGCESQLTLDNGIKIKYEVPIPKSIRRLDRKIMKKNRKDSKNKYKDKLKREKQYKKITNIKKDIKNKIVSLITNNYKYVIMQDENINAWKAGNHGKKIQNSSIGGIISDLKLKSHTPIIVDRFFPSSQLCICCGHKQKMKQEVRTYECSECGNIIDRDLNASLNLRSEGIKQIPTEHRKFKPLETGASTCNFIDRLNSIYRVKASSCH